MTASALSGYATGSLQYISLAIVLAFMVGGILLIAGLIRLGWIMQFVSRGVASGFISGAAVLIILVNSNIIGIPLNTDSLINLFLSIYTSTQPIHLPTALLGIGATLLFIISRYGESIIWGWLPTQWRGFGNRFLSF